MENTIHSQKAFTERNVKANKERFTTGGWREMGMENKLFYSNLLRTDKLPGDITGIFALLLAIPPLYRPIYLLPDNSAACPSASPYSNSRVGQSTEPCNGEIFVVTWEKG